MANFSELKTRIDTNINTNGARGITGATLNADIKAIIDAVNEYKADSPDAPLATGENYIPAALAENLSSWEGREELPVEDTWSNIVRTTAGDISIVSNKGGKLVNIYPKSDFYATSLLASGFNLLRLTTMDTPFIGGSLTGGYYFIVPKMAFGTYGTADEPNGVLFTNSSNQNQTPTVLFKALTAGVPTSTSDGSSATYVDSNGYRFYTASQPGYFIVTGSTANMCAHIAWSSRYSEYKAIDATGDAASVLTLSGLMSSSSPLRFINNEVRDYIAVSGTTAIRYTLCGSVSIAAGSWINTENPSETGSTTYTHSAPITGIKTNGVARMSDGTLLTVEGITVSFTDSNSTVGSAITVIYELPSPVTSSISNIYGSENETYKLEDWGIEVLVNASGEFAITTSYSQGYPDTLATIAQIGFSNLENELIESKERISELESEIIELNAKDPDMKYGQPRILYGNGTPQESVVPTNWIQYLDGGYNWNGNPSALGQMYINTASGGLAYVAVRDGYTLAWKSI